MAAKLSVDPPAAALGRWKVAAFSVVTTILFFAIVEAALWIAGVRTLSEMRDPSMGFSGEARVFERDARRGVWATTLRAVKHSFNPESFALNKPSNGLRVFTIGGSSAWGFPWGARVAFPRALGQALQATYPDRAVESINAAAMSYGSARLRLLTQEILKYQPDVLIVFEGHNEFVERGLQRQVTEAPAVATGLAPLNRSRLYALMTRAWEKARPRSDVAPGTGGRSVGELLGLDVVRETSRYVDETEKSDAVIRFRENYDAMVALARADGVAVVLCTVPSNLAGWKPNQSVFAPSTPPDVRRAITSLLREAEARVRSGGAADLVADLEAASVRDPGHAETWFRLGEALNALGRYDQAHAAFVRARDLDAMPTRVISAVNDAIRSFEGRPGVTVVDVERLFESEAEHGLVGFDLIEDYVHPTPRAHRLVARALWTALVEGGIAGESRLASPGTFEAAAGPLEETGGQAESSPRLLYNLGIVLENKGLVDEAMSRFRACLALDPTYYAAAYNLGRLLHTRGRFEEAAAAHRQALAADPGYVLSMVGLGEALRAQGRATEAIEVLARATREDQDSAYAWNGLGAALAVENRAAEAEAAFRRAIALQPDRSDSRANLGYALLAQGKLADAEDVFRESLRAAPDHLASRNGLAATLVQTGSLEDAARLFEDTLRVAPGNRFAQAGLAEIARRRGK